MDQNLKKKKKNDLNSATSGVGLAEASKQLAWFLFAYEVTKSFLVQQLYIPMSQIYQMELKRKKYIHIWYPINHFSL